MKKPIPKELTVRVERAFRIGGEEVPVGEVIVLDYKFAVELLTANKVSKTNALPTGSAKAEEAPKADAKPNPKPAPKADAKQSPVAPAKGE